MLNEFETENMNIETAVRKTLVRVTIGVPSLPAILSLKKLHMTVPNAMSIEIIPMYDTGTFSCENITGQADPRRESGNPRLMKDR